MKSRGELIPPSKRAVTLSDEALSEMREDLEKSESKFNQDKNAYEMALAEKEKSAQLSGQFERAINWGSDELGVEHRLISRSFHNNKEFLVRSFNEASYARGNKIEYSAMTALITFVGIGMGGLYQTTNSFDKSASLTLSITTLAASVSFIQSRYYGNKHRNVIRDVKAELEQNNNSTAIKREVRGQIKKHLEQPYQVPSLPDHNK